MLGIMSKPGTYITKMVTILNTEKPSTNNIANLDSNITICLEGASSTDIDNILRIHNMVLLLAKPVM